MHEVVKVRKKPKEVKEALPRRRWPWEMGNTPPDLPGDDHRPSGAPRAREVRSQKARLQSQHRLKGNKGVKIGMEYKTGARERPREGN